MTIFRGSLTLIQSIMRRMLSTLKYKLIASFIAVSIIPILIVSYVFYVNMTRIMVEKDTANSIRLNYNKMSNLDKSLGEFERILSDLTTNTKTTDYLKGINFSNYESDTSYTVLSEVAARLDIIKATKDNLIDSIYLLPDKGGIPLFRGFIRTSYSEQNDFTELPIYKETVLNKTQFVWKYEIDLDTQKPVLSVSKSINDVFSDQILGIVVIFLDLKTLFEDLNTSAMEPGEYLYIVNKRNEMIYNTALPKGWEESKPQSKLDQVVKSDNGSFPITFQQTAYIATFTTSHFNGWKIVDIIPYRSIVQGVQQISRIAVILTLIGAIIAIIIAIFVYINICKPIFILIRAMKRAEQGQLDTHVTLKRNDELGGLAKAFNYLIDCVQNLIHDVETEQKTKRKLEVKALQAQITPHFLYNTLNSIKSLARLGRNEHIIDMVGALIDLLRISASNRKDTITLREELNYVQGYVKIMRYRYQQPFEIIIDADEALLDYGILKFSLQPIVENCIIHAFTADQLDQLMVIKVIQQGDHLVITVKDNGIGMDPAAMNEDFKNVGSLIERPEKSTRNKGFSGIGIRNIHDRLRLNYGDGYGLEFEAELGKGTTVLVTIPLVEVIMEQTNAIYS